MIELLHVVEVGIIGQLAIDIVVGLVIGAKGKGVYILDFYGVKDIEGFVIHTDIRAANSQQRTATDGRRLVANTISQRDALTQEVHSRIADKGLIEFIETIVLSVSPFGCSLQCQRATSFANLLLMGSNIVLRVGDGLIYLQAICRQVLLSKDRRSDKRKATREYYQQFLHPSLVSACKDTKKSGKYHYFPDIFSWNTK